MNLATLEMLLRRCNELAFFSFFGVCLWFCTAYVDGPMSGKRLQGVRDGIRLVSAFSFSTALAGWLVINSLLIPQLEQSQPAQTLTVTDAFLTQGLWGVSVAHVAVNGQIFVVDEQVYGIARQGGTFCGVIGKSRLYSIQHGACAK